MYLDYQPVPILFELRNLPRVKGDSEVDHYRGVRYGVIVDCEGGYLAGGWAYDWSGQRIKQFRLTEGAGHHENFIQAVRSRKVSDLNADVQEGYLSAALCHMGNISQRLGKQASRDEIAASFKGNPDLGESFERFQEHLLVNGVDVKQTPRMLGSWLTMDPQTEKFTGQFADEANKLARGSYREPFVVPGESLKQRKETHDYHIPTLRRDSGRERPRRFRGFRQRDEPTESGGSHAGGVLPKRNEETPGSMPQRHQDA